MGVLFGVVVAESMIRNPERISRNHIAFVIVPILLALFAWVVIYEPTNIVAKSTWILCFLTTQVVFFISPGGGSDGRLEHSKPEVTKKQNKSEQATPRKPSDQIGS